MVRMDGAETKAIRVSEIAKFIQAALTANKENGWIPLKQTVARLAVKMGLTSAKVKEYLKELEATGDQFWEICESEDKIKRTEVQVCV